jgi:sodium transport system ATP-binding protein
MQQAAIEAEELVKHYRSTDGRVVRAVDGVSFAVARGETVGLLGGNGAGKTTLLRLLTTLLAPTAGTARIEGLDIRRSPIEVRRRVGYVSAGTGVPDRLSGLETLLAYGRLHGIPAGLLRDSAARLVEALDMGAFIDRPCGRLSSGQRQRVSLARALVHDPPVLVLDEPTSSLDLLGARELLDLLERLRGEGRAILISTHRLHEIEPRCDRFVIIHEGRIVASTDRETLLASGGSLEDAFFTAVGE